MQILRGFRKRHTVMNNITGRHCIGGTYPTLEARAGDWEDVQDMTDDQLALLHEKALEVTAALMNRLPLGTLRNILSRFHVVRAIVDFTFQVVFVKPSNCCEVRLFQTVTMKILIQCAELVGKKCCQRVGKDAPEESSSTASSSSTACSQELS